MNSKNQLKMTELSEIVKMAIKEFDKEHVIRNIILLGVDESIRNIQIGFEFDEDYRDEEELSK